MNDPGALWQDCDSADGFAVFLQLMTADLLGSQRLYGERDLGDFFWSWARAVGSGWLRGAASLAIAEDEPGWRCLAFQVHDALTGRPGFNCVWADWGTDWQEVRKRYHLPGLLGGLATSVFRERRESTKEDGRSEPTGDRGRWTQLTLGGYLAGWAAWLENADASVRAQVEPVTWHTIAFQINAARSYEQLTELA